MTDKPEAEKPKTNYAAGNPLGLKPDVAAPMPGLKPAQQRQQVVGRLRRMHQLHTSVESLEDWYVGEALLRAEEQPSTYVDEEADPEMARGKAAQRWLAFLLRLSPSDVDRAELVRKEYSFAELEELACLDSRVLVAAARIPKPERLEILRSFVQRAQSSECLPTRDMLSALREHRLTCPTCRSADSIRAPKPSSPEALVRQLRRGIRGLAPIGQELHTNLLGGGKLTQDAVLGAIGSLDTLDYVIGGLRVEVEKHNHLSVPRYISILSGRDDSDPQVNGSQADGQVRTNLERTALEKKSEEKRLIRNDLGCGELSEYRGGTHGTPPPRGPLLGSAAFDRMRKL